MPNLPAEDSTHHELTLAPARERFRLSYLSADVNARLLFALQPPRHAPAGGAAWAAVLLPRQPSGAPRSWLSGPSAATRALAAQREGVALDSLRLVVGRIVEVSQPVVVSSTAAGLGCTTDNPYNLAAGARYCVIHAEMVLAHRWGTL